MSFRTNDSQQISMFDSFNLLTEREQKALVRSWAKVFAEEIFPTIDEERFSVLYSEDKASRPNTPVNIIIGALILKELLNLSDDEVVENLMLKDHLEKMDEQSEETVLIADGAYSGTDNANLAFARTLKLSFKLLICDFTFSSYSFSFA